MTPHARRGWLGVALLVALAGPAKVPAVGFADLESSVQKYVLPNGLTFLVLERHTAPVFAFRTFVDAGGVDEVPGISGIAHMFEHMAFKGTQSIGTTNYAAEAESLDAVDRAWDVVAKERARGYAADSTALKRDLDRFAAAQEGARQYVVSNDFSKVLEEQGVVGLNAFTGTDYTQYLYALPSNRLELWARLEADRLTQPVLREFYKERDVVQEERRFGESSAQGRLFYAFINAAFQAHPYGIGTIGFSSDLKAITRADAREFFAKHYTAPNITIAVVGDVKFDEVRRLADKYFGGVSSAPKPAPVRTVEPEHNAEVRLELIEDAVQMVMMGYHIPSRFDPDWRAYELLADILGSGRSSRFYERLVKQDKVAAQVFTGAGFPGSKYPSLLLIGGVVSKDATPEQVEEELDQEMQRLIDEGPTAGELAKVKTMNKADFIRGLRGSLGLAGQLALFEGQMGDYHKLFDYLDEIDRVTTADIQRAAAKVLVKKNRVVGIIRKPAS
ncbi:MAG: pitrilysin family protein [Candidatus Eisenbacteria bacterium]